MIKLLSSSSNQYHSNLIFNKILKCNLPNKCSNSPNLCSQYQSSSKIRWIWHNNNNNMLWVKCNSSKEEWSRRLPLTLNSNLSIINLHLLCTISNSREGIWMQICNFKNKTINQIFNQLWINQPLSRLLISRLWAIWDNDDKEFNVINKCTMNTLNN